MNKMFTDGDRKIYITDNPELIAILDELFSNKKVDSEELSELEPIKKSEPIVYKFNNGEFKGMTPEEVVKTNGIPGAIKMFKIANTFGDAMKNCITETVKKAIRNDLEKRNVSSSMDDLKSFINLYGCMLNKQIKTILESLSLHNIEEFYKGNFSEKIIHDFHEALYNNLKKRVG